jgi:putative ABC transport system permease protein
MLWHDFRHGLRLLARMPAFAAAVALTLGLGIGVNTGIFSVVRALLLRPYPFPQLERLVLVREIDSGSTAGEIRFTPADYRDLRSESGAFEDVAASRFHAFSFEAEGDSEGAEGFLVSPRLFELLGAQPLLGRALRAGDDEPGHDDVVVVDYGTWQRRFAGDRRVVGRVVRLDGRPVTVVGVMPEGFHYPLGAELWAPLALDPREWSERSVRSLSVVGRLSPGSTLRQAQARVASVAARLAERHPSSNASRTVSLLPLRDEQLEYTAPLFLMLQAAAGLVLLLACANVTSVFLARAIERQREIAIRRAMGASTLRLALHFAGEMCGVALLAGGLATAVAFWSVDLIRASVPAGIARWLAGWSGIRVDGPVLLFGLLLTLGVGGLFGLVAGLRAGRVDVNRALKDGTGSSPARARHRLLRLLVVAEVGLAVILLVGAGLAAEAFVLQTRAYARFQPAGVLHLKIELPAARYPDAGLQRTFWTEALAGLAALPGANSVAAGGNVPGSGEPNGRATFTIEGRPTPAGHPLPSADLQPVSSGYFELLRIPIERGRALSEGDGPGAPPVAVISRSLARRFWPESNAVGERLKLGPPESDAPWVTIVGVAADVKQNWWDSPSQLAFYVPYPQRPGRRIHLMLRATADAASLAALARGRLQRLDGVLPLTDVERLDQFVAGPMSLLQIVGGLMTAFGGMALLLAAVGVAGILAQSVAERRQEFGVRMAVGAGAQGLVRLVMIQASKLVALGLGVGLAAALLLSRWMSSLLFGVVGVDPRILAGVAVFLAAVALAAAYAPARRIARLDPALVLRQD